MIGCNKYKFLQMEGFQEAFLDAIGKGLPLNLATQLCGISVNLFHKYNRACKDLLQDIADEKITEKTLRANEQECLKFYFAYKKARAKWALRNISLIQAAAENTDWKAGAWLLERCFPEEFSRQTNIQHDIGADTMEQGASITMNLGVMPNEHSKK